MTWLIPLSTSTVGAAVPLPGADSLFVSEGVTLASSTGYAVQTGGGSNQEIVVHGTVVGWAGILATNVTGATITVGETGRVSGLNANAMFIVGTDTEIHNAGTIETLSTISKGIMLSGTVAGSTATLENSGTIRAIDTAIQTNTKLGTLQVDNSGLIWAKGDAFFDGVGSIDTIVNTGTIQGDVKLGGGQDLFDSRKGLVDGEVYGGSGNDRLYTGLGSQQIYG
jgi:hypothetical protein